MLTVSASENLNSTIAVFKDGNISFGDESVVGYNINNSVLADEDEIEIFEYSLNSSDSFKEENDVSDKKTSYLRVIGNLEMSAGITNFYYNGKPLKIGLQLKGMGNDVPTGNVTAVCNGNIYQGVFGNYVHKPYDSRGGGSYNFYFEITNYTLGENVIEFIYSGDANYNGYSIVKTFTSIIGHYDGSNNNKSKKSIYFYRIRNYERDWDMPSNGYMSFYYGKPLKIVMDLRIPPNWDKSMENIIAVCNGNVYQGVYGKYPVYTNYIDSVTGEPTGETELDYVYNFLFEITNYTLGENVIEFIYLGDDDYNASSQLITFKSKVDYDISPGAGVPSGNIAFASSDVLYKNFNLYNATGNLTVICNDVVTYYNLTGDLIKHEITNYYLGTNNITLIYSGDNAYNGFVTQCAAYTYLSIGCSSKEIYVGDVVRMIIFLDNATGNVTVTVNNNSYNVNLIEGIAYLEIANYTIGYNKVDVAYSGDDFYPSFLSLDDLNRGFTVLGKRNLVISSCLVQNDNANCLIIQIFNEKGLIGNGSLNLTIDGKDVIVDFVNGVAVYNLTEDTFEDIVVNYAGDNMYNPISSSAFTRLANDYVVTNDNYMYYFNQGDGGRLFDWVSSGVTLDFRGSIIAPGAYFNVNKPVNIISSTKDAFIDFNTTAGSLLGENPGARFAITHGGSWSNVTGIFFHNTQVWLENVTHVILDNISVVVEDQRV